MGLAAFSSSGFERLVFRETEISTLRFPYGRLSEETAWLIITQDSEFSCAIADLPGAVPRRAMEPISRFSFQGRLSFFFPQVAGERVALRTP